MADQPEREARTRSAPVRQPGTLSYALNYRFAGSNPAPHHRLNILLHAANGLLVLLLFRRLGAGEVSAAAGAFLFAAHGYRESPDRSTGLLLSLQRPSPNP